MGNFENSVHGCPSGDLPPFQRVGAASGRSHSGAENKARLVINFDLSTANTVFQNNAKVHPNARATLFAIKF